MWNLYAGQSASKEISTHEPAGALYEVLHWDVNGPLTAGLQGELYFATILEEKSRYLWTMVFKKKSEIGAWTSQVLKSLSAEAKTIGCRIMKLRADHGSEVLGGVVLNTLAEELIKPEFVCTYFPRLNRLVKIVQGTLLTRMRCLLKQSNLPEVFWSQRSHRWNWCMGWHARLMQKPRSECMVFPEEGDPIRPSKLEGDPKPQLSLGRWFHPGWRAIWIRGSSGFSSQT